MGIVVDSFTQPLWVREIVKGLSGRLAAVTLVPKQPRPRRLLHDLYLRADRALFRSQPDAFAEGDLSGLLGGCEVVQEVPEGLDVVLAFAPCPARDAWRLYDDPLEALPGFLEVLEASPTTFASVEAGGTVLRGSHGPTDHISVNRNRNALAHKRAALVLRAIADLPAGAPRQEPAHPRPPRPGNLAMLSLLARLFFRYLRGKLRHLLSIEQWRLAYRFEESPREGLDGLVELVPPKDRFWADPFPVRTPDGRTFVFFEELFYRDWKGRIMVGEIVPGEPFRPRVALERPYHMSYPQVFLWEGQHYMLPETAANRTVTLFRCVSFPDRWVEERDLLRDVDAVDATITEADGRFFMFVNLGLEGAGNRDELHLYSAPSPLGPWTAHPQNPVKSDCRSARPAGAPFRRGGALFRPAQNCGGEYGASVVLHRVDELSPGRYRETGVAEILPPPGRERLHTINRCEGFLVVDLLRRCRRFS